MAHCQKCGKSFPFYSTRQAKRLHPLEEGHLCDKCYRPYDAVLKIHHTNLKKAAADPRAAVWVALCYLLAAQRVNLVRTLTVAIMGYFETHNSWETCRYRAIELANQAMSMLPAESEGRLLVQEVIIRAENIAAAPAREISLQRYASVMENTILDIEHDALVRSGITIDNLNEFVASLPGHQWLLNPGI